MKARSCLGSAEVGLSGLADRRLASIHRWIVRRARRGGRLPFPVLENLTAMTDIRNHEPDLVVQLRRTPLAISPRRAHWSMHRETRRPSLPSTCRLQSSN